MKYQDKEVNTIVSKMSKKGQLQIADLPRLGLLIGVTALILGILALVLTQVGNQTNDNEVTKAVQNGTLAAGNISSNLPLIGTIVALAVVLGVVVIAFGRRLLG